MTDDQSGSETIIKVGPNRQILDELPPPGYLETECIVIRDGVFIRLIVTSHSARSPERAVSIATPSAGLIEMSNDYPGVELRLESINIATSKAPKPDKRLKCLALIQAFAKAATRAAVSQVQLN